MSAIPWIKLEFLWNPTTFQAVCSTNDNLPAYVLALLRRSVHACMSAKARIPRQLIGWSWDSKNSQQVLFTSCSCKRPAAGSSTWKEKQELVNVPIQFWYYIRVLAILRKQNKPLKTPRLNQRGRFQRYATQEVKTQHEHDFASLQIPFRITSSISTIVFTGEVIPQTVTHTLFKLFPIFIHKLPSCISQHFIITSHFQAFSVGYFWKKVF